MSPDERSQDDRRIAKLLAYVITFAWIVSFVIDIFNEAYDPPASLQGLIMLVAGGVFGEGIIRSVVQQKTSTSQTPSKEL